MAQNGIIKGRLTNKINNEGLRGYVLSDRGRLASIRGNYAESEKYYQKSVSSDLAGIFFEKDPKKLLLKQ